MAGVTELIVVVALVQVSNTSQKLFTIKYHSAIYILVVILI